MAQKFNKRVVLAKIESTYGTDAAPTGSANAIRVVDPRVTPLEGGTVERNLLRPELGADAKVHVGSHVRAEFGVEIAGPGTPGTAPAYGPLLRACAMAETLVTGTATIQNSPPTGVGTPTGSFTYTNGTKFSGLVDRTVTLTCTTAGGSGVAAFTVAAPTTVFDAAYNQTGVVMTDSASFALPNGATITPTVGTAFAVSDQFTIALTPERADYDPVSANEESASIYFNMDGTLHKLLGARGNVSLRIPARDIPRFQFQFVGLWADPATVALPTADFSAFQDPVTTGNTNTPLFTLHGFAAVLEELSIDMGNSVEHRELIGAETVERTDRVGSGSITIESPALASKNFFTTAKANTLGALQLIHGTAAGGIVQLDVPKVQLLQPQYSESQGIAMLQMGLVPVPDTGDDELKISVK